MRIAVLHLLRLLYSRYHGWLDRSRMYTIIYRIDVCAPWVLWMHCCRGSRHALVKFPVILATTPLTAQRRSQPSPGCASVLSV